MSVIHHNKDCHLGDNHKECPACIELSSDGCLTNPRESQAMTTSKSETPLTDARVRERNPIGEWGNTAIIDTNFARKLETMLSLAEGALEHIHKNGHYVSSQNAEVVLAKISELKATL
jgi:hypothetical protein